MNGQRFSNFAIQVLMTPVRVKLMSEERSGHNQRELGMAELAAKSFDDLRRLVTGADYRFHLWVGLDGAAGSHRLPLIPPLTFCAVRGADRKVEYRELCSAIRSLHVRNASSRTPTGARSRWISARHASCRSVGAASAGGTQQARAVADARHASDHACCRGCRSCGVVATDSARETGAPAGAHLQRATGS